MEYIAPRLYSTARTLTSFRTVNEESTEQTDWDPIISHSIKHHREKENDIWNMFFCGRVLSPFGFRSTVPSPTQILEAASEGTNRSSFRARTTSTSTGGVCIRFVSGPENLVPKNFLLELAFFPLEVDLLT